jgi:pyruvate/2-oxoglutarate dehydrogenase complex dihydrolipoamide acyltransferase (E2) component
VPVELTLPALSPSTDYATVLRWLKREGDLVSAGEVVVEVEADKANCEIEATVGGLLESVIAVEGDEVSTGGVLALIEPQS